MSHDWVKAEHSWVCPACRACLVPEATERFGMAWPPSPRDEVRLVDIEFKGPCWPKAPIAEQELAKWKWSVAGQSYAARLEVADVQRCFGTWAPDPVP